jgi:hypothetical protein
MPVRHWGNDPEVAERGTWDTLFIGGKLMPGLAEVSLKLPTGIKKRKSKGQRGARLKDEGAEPREVRITLTLWLPEHIAAADDARDFICGRANGDPSDPLDIRHEAVNYFRIGAVVLGDVDIDPPNAVDGWVWNIQAFEYLPDAAIKAVKDQNTKAQDDAAAWSPYRDDGVAGSGAPPSAAGAAHDNLPNPRAP